MELYDVGFCMVAVPVFLGSWAWAIDSWGPMIGFALGWLPALVLALMAGALWPVLVLSFLVPGLLIIGI
jgi:uncharacterized membrane protein YoaK (UPF0700 family)